MDQDEEKPQVVLHTTFTNYETGEETDIEVTTEEVEKRIKDVGAGVDYEGTDDFDLLKINVRGVTDVLGDDTDLFDTSTIPLMAAILHDPDGALDNKLKADGGFDDFPQMKCGTYYVTPTLNSDSAMGWANTSAILSNDREAITGGVEAWEATIARVDTEDGEDPAPGDEIPESAIPEDERKWKGWAFLWPDGKPVTFADVINSQTMLRSSVAVLAAHVKQMHDQPTMDVARAIMPTDKLATATTVPADLLQNILASEPKSGKFMIGNYEAEQVEERRKVTGDVIVTTLRNTKAHNADETIELITPDLRNANGDRIRGDKRRRVTKLYAYVMDQLSSNADVSDPKNRHYNPVFIRTTDLVEAGIYADRHDAWDAIREVLPGLGSITVSGHWGGPHGPYYTMGRRQMFHVDISDKSEGKQGACVSVARNPDDERTVFEFINKYWGYLDGDTYQLGEVAALIQRKAFHELRIHANDEKNRDRHTVRMGYATLIEAAGLRDMRPDKAHKKVMDALAEISANEKAKAKRDAHAPWLTLRKVHMTNVRDAEDAGYVTFTFIGDYLQDNVTVMQQAQQQKKKAARKKADQPTTRRRRKKADSDTK